MKRNNGRRHFLRHSILGSGLLLMQPLKSMAARQVRSNSNNETLKTLHSLRTIHGDFTQQDIPQEQIDDILSASVRAANASALQSYSIIVIRDRDKMREICGYSGSCMFVYCVDFNRLIDCANALDLEYKPEGTTSFVTASVSTSLAVQTAVIAAKSMGIDSLVTNGIHRRDFEKQWKLLNLPEKYCFPLIATVFGYAKDEPEYQKGRIQGAGIVHKDQYNRLTAEQTQDLIKEYDQTDNHLGLNENWKRDGLDHYFSWLFGVWHKRSATPKNQESQLFQFLKRSNFVDMQKS